MQDKPKEFQIFVNTKPRKVVGPSISFEQVLAEAGINTAGQDLNLYDVEWTHGNRAGALTPGQSVLLENGMRFDAGKSNRS
jgi:hypothetical protein